MFVRASRFFVAIMLCATASGCSTLQQSLPDLIKTLPPSSSEAGPASTSGASAPLAVTPSNVIRSSGSTTSAWPTSCDRVSWPAPVNKPSALNLQNAVAVAEVLGFKGLGNVVKSGENLVNVLTDSEMLTSDSSKQNYLYKALGREQHLISPMAAYRFGNFSMARAKAEAIVAQQKAQFGPKSLQHAQALALLATVTTDAGVAAANDGAAEAWREAAAIFRELRQETPEGLSLYSYGVLLARGGRGMQLKPVADRLLSLQGALSDVRMLALALAARVDATEGRIGNAIAKLGTALQYWDTRLTSQQATQNELTQRIFGAHIEEGVFELVPQLEASLVLAQAAEVLSAIGQHESAVRLLEKAIEKTNSTAAHMRPERVDIFLRLAMERVEIGRRDDAAASLKTVRNMHWWNLVFYNRAVAEKNYALGQLATAANDSAEAEMRYRAALAWWQTNLGGSAEALRPVAALARLHTKGAQLHSAETFATTGVCFADRQRGTLGLGHGSRDAESIRDAYIAYLELITAKSKSNSFAEAGALAFRAMQGATAGVAQRDIELGLLRLAASEKRVSDLLARRAQLSAALERARRSRASEYILQSGLLSEIQSAAQREAPSDPQSKAIWLQQVNDSRQFTVTAAAVPQSIEQLARELDQVNVQLAALNGAAGLGGKDVGLDQVRQALGADEAFVQFLVADDRTYVIALDKQSAHLAAIDIDRKTLARATGRIRQSLASAETKPFDEGAAADLYRALLQPVSEIIANKKRLSIVKDGPLAEIPFSLLRTPSGLWLAEAHEITTVVSASNFVLARKQLRASRAPKPFFGIGHPIAPPRPQQSAATVEQALGIKLVTRGLSDLAELPEAGNELKAFATAFGSGHDSLLLREAATPSRVRDARLSEYRVISFATHALLPGQHMLSDEAAIVLSPPSGSSDPTAAVLKSSDIAGLKLDADVVILSACNTASGNDTLGGDRLGGLARAFFTSGARRVLVSHWAVNSAATQDLMTRFATHYKASANASAALRAAMLGMIKDAKYKHPYYWAAFDVVG